MKDMIALRGTGGPGGPQAPAGAARVRPEAPGQEQADRLRRAARAAAGWAPYRTQTWLNIRRFPKTATTKIDAILTSSQKAQAPGR